MQDWFEITNKGKPTGEVQLKFEFSPRGARRSWRTLGHLKDTDTLGRQDPYIIFKLSSELVKIERRTKTDTDGGTEPVWEEAVEMPLVDQYELVAEVYDADMIGSDDVIGKAALSLLPVFKNGFADQWVPIGTRNKWGRAESCGEIHLEFDFKGPPGVAYPQLRPDIDTFDDSERVDREREAEMKKEEEDRAHEEFQKGISSSPALPSEGDPKSKSGKEKEEGKKRREEKLPTRPRGLLTSFRTRKSWTHSVYSILTEMAFSA